jgi:two-component system cell cycle sensor histidine kinase/response regulator CckA
MSSNSTEDFANLIRISSAQIVCFELQKPISCSHAAESFAALLYTVPTRCVDGSISAAQACGFEDVDSMVGQTLERIFPASAGYGELFKKWHRLSLSGQSFELSLQACGRAPAILSVAIYGKIDSGERLSRFWIVLRDVTPQMRATRAVASAELHYRRLIERTGVIFARVNPGGYYEYISPSLASALGVSLEDIAARRRKLCEWVHPEDQEKVEILLTHRNAAHAHSVTEIELRMRLFNDYRVLSVRQLAALDPISGRLSFIDLIATDVTQLRDLEAHVANITAQTHYSQRAAVVGHDMRNHLTACLGHLENALESVSSRLEVDPTSLKAALIAAKATSELASSLAQSIPGLSAEVDSPNCDVAESLSALALVVAPLLPERIHLKIPLLHAQLRVNLSLPQLHNVLLNLVLNARDAIGAAGGEIEISAAASPTSSAAILTVQDDGSGISPDIIARIFDPYFSTKRDVGGTGLGLASVRDTVAAAGGTIEVESAPHIRRGTIFTITLPRFLHGDGQTQKVLAQQISASTSRADPDSTMSASPLRILVADDELGICSMLEVALGRRGHQVEVVSDSERFMTQATQGARRYDLLVIDESLPRKRSSEVLRYLRSIMPKTPIIVTSGDPSIRDAVQRVASSVYFLPKPFSIGDIEGAIRHSCG